MQELYFVLDVESVGLYGEGFSAGYVVDAFLLNES